MTEAPFHICVDDKNVLGLHNHQSAHTGVSSWREYGDPLCLGLPLGEGYPTMGEVLGEKGVSLICAVFF